MISPEELERVRRAAEARALLAAGRYRYPTFPLEDLSLNVPPPGTSHQEVREWKPFAIDDAAYIDSLLSRETDPLGAIPRLLSRETLALASLDKLDPRGCAFVAPAFLTKARAVACRKRIDLLALVGEIKAKCLQRFAAADLLEANEVKSLD